MVGEINFGLIDPNAGLKAAATMDVGAAARTQQQLHQQEMQMNQLKLQQLVEDRKRLNDFSSKMAAAGKNPDPAVYLQSMLESGIPDMIKLGHEGMQKLRDQAAFETTYRSLYPNLFPTAKAAPAGAAPFGTTSPVGAAPAGAAPFGAAPVETPSMGAAPVNNLAPPAVTPVNNLAPTVGPSAITSRIAELDRQIKMFDMLADPRAKEQSKALREEKKQLTQSHVVSPGGTLLVEGQPIFTAPAAKTQLDQYIAAREALPGGQNNPLYKVYSDAITKLSTHPAPASTTVQLPPQEKAEQGARGAMLVKQYGDISDAAKLATKSLPAIESNLDILNKGFDTGWGTETQAMGAKVLGALGIKDAEKYATKAQTFVANASAAVLQKQLEQKGPQTEADANRISQTGAQLGNTKEANQFILDVAKAQLKRDIDQRNFYDKWWKTNKTYDGAEDAWVTGEGGKSLFDRPELAKYKPQTQPGTAYSDPAKEKRYQEWKRQQGQP